MKTLVEALLENKEKYGDKVAIITKKESVTYSEISDRIVKLAGFFKTMGIKKGDFVILEAVPEVSYVLCYLALRYIGAVTAPVERGVDNSKLIYITELLDASLYISKNDNRAKEKVVSKFYENLLSDAKEWAMGIPYERLNDDSVAEIIFTTGTTGRPKAAMHSSGGICCNTSNTINGIGMKSDDCILLPLPLNHSFGMRVLRSALEIGACLVLQSGAIFADSLINNIKKYKCNAMACVSATMESVLREIGEERVTEEFGGLRYIEFSAGAVPVPMRKKLLEILPNTAIHNTWGSSETGGCLFLNVRENPEKITAVGRALEHIDLGIYSEDKDEFINENGEKNIGRLAIKGDMVFKGYYKQDDVYKESIKDDWYVTNDLVWRDEDNYFYILGRADNVINVGGEKVAPSEIENALFEVKEISGCACIGVPDTEGILGEIPVLLYSIKKGTTVSPENIDKILSERIGQYKKPRKLIEVPYILKNYMNKIDYKALKKIYLDQGEDGFKTLEDNQSEDSKRVYDLNNEVIQAIMNRKSRRKFTEDKVPSDVIETLVAAGKCAPSGKNLQTRRFTVISNQEEIYALKELIAEVAKEKHTSFNGFENPPLLILISNDRRNKDGIQDVGVSAENIMIAGESLGLGSVWLNPLMEISDEERIRRKLDEYTIPKNHIVWAVMAVGYPEGPAPVFERKPNQVYYVS